MKRPALPATLRILGKTYRVVLSPVNRLTTTAWGEFDASKGEIVLEDGHCHDQTADTLLHEAIHGIEYAMKLSMP